MDEPHESIVWYVTRPGRLAGVEVQAGDYIVRDPVHRTHTLHRALPPNDGAMLGAEADGLLELLTPASSPAASASVPAPPPRAGSPPGRVARSPARARHLHLF